MATSFQVARLTRLRLAHQRRKIVNRYRGMTRIFLLIVDHDCDDNRRAKLDALEKRAETMLAGTDRCFLAENAWQESEVWVLAGMSDLPDDKTVIRRNTTMAPMPGSGMSTRIRTGAEGL